MKSKSLYLAVLFLLISIVFAASFKAEAKKSENKTKKTQKIASNKNGAGKSGAASNDPQKRLKKDVSFDDHAVGGQYQIPYGSMTVVEDEKALDDLIGVRKNFNDRVEQTKGMR